jgi:GntR family transcriptional regulator, arabinose operon transcriptional repressor
MNELSANRKVSLLHLEDRQFTPKYLDLAQKVLRDIADRGLKPGDLLGTETELVARHRLSRATVRQALSVLARDGYVSRKRAQGTFVGNLIDPASKTHLSRGTVLVICSNEQTAHLHEDFAFATILRLIERSLAKKGFSVQILGVGENPPDDRARLQRLLQQGHIDGICAIGTCFEAYRSLVSDKFLVVSSCSFSPLAAPWVGQDIRAVSRECVKYLVDRGHRQIAMVCGSTIDQAAFAIFASGYRDAFAEASLPLNRQLLCQSYPGEPLMQLFIELMSGPSRPTAIFAENWRVCQAMLAAANQLGLKIPDDISLVGYGQNVQHLSGPVAITSYVPEAEAIGEGLANILTTFAEGQPLPKEPIFIPGRLVEGESVKAL